MCLLSVVKLSILDIVALANFIDQSIVVQCLFSFHRPQCALQTLSMQLSTPRVRDHTIDFHTFDCVIVIRSPVL